VPHLRILVGIVVLASAAAGCGGKQTPSPTSPTPPGQPTLSAPAIAAPGDDQVVDSIRPELRVKNVTADQTGERTYQFQLSSDGNFDAAGSLVANKTGVPEGGADGTAWRVDLDLSTSARYFWRARAAQGSTQGAWSGTARFRTIANAPPVIVSLTLSPPRAEVNDEIDVVAVVQDRETPPETLTYEWSADKGAFTGTGARVRWRAPKDERTPATYDLRLTVVEHFTAPRDEGGTETKEHRVAASAPVRVNDSRKEITDLVLTFLGDFANSSVSPQTCIRNFSDSCHGKQEELQDITNGRARGDSISSDFHVSDIQLDADRRFANITAPCMFTSRLKANGHVEVAKGTCTLTSIYENGRWWLCDSHFTGTTTFGLTFPF
jgi:hypothetical protein